MTLRQKAYQAIKNKIIYFELKPGEKVLESNMARTLNLGRVPVREALTMLESERLIVKNKGYGYVVTRIKNKEVEDYFNIRIQLESYGASLFFKRATDNDIRRLRKHIDKAPAIYRDGDTHKIIESDTRFHQKMYKATRSEVFCQTIASLEDKTIIMRAAALHTVEGREASLLDHLAIMKAIEQKDLKKLIDLIVDHVKFASRYYDSIRPMIFY